LFSDFIFSSVWRSSCEICGASNFAVWSGMSVIIEDNADKKSKVENQK
jgi:RNA polymerase subunit RPABC4/transcription elongation factor Spt4